MKKTKTLHFMQMLAFKSQHNLCIAEKTMYGGKARVIVFIFTTELSINPEHIFDQFYIPSPHTIDVICSSLGMLIHFNVNTPSAVLRPAVPVLSANGLIG